MTIDRAQADHDRKHHKRTAWRCRSLWLTFGVCAALLVTSSYWLPIIGTWVAVPTHLAPADVIIVSGGSAARTLHGVTLYHQGLGPELWHTGYARGKQRISAEILARGVSAGAFHYLSTTSTWTDGEQIAAEIRARDLRRVLLVTDWWHSRRALCSLRSQLGEYSVEVAFSPAPSPTGPSDWWSDQATRTHVMSELVKMGYYIVRYGMRPWRCEHDRGE